MLLMISLMKLMLLMVVLIMNETFTDKLTAEIIDVASELGVELSPTDATAIAIYTLHGIITATGNVEIDSIKRSICEIVGDSDKIGNYLFTTLAGISATDDEIVDKAFAEKGVV